MDHVQGRPLRRSRSLLGAQALQVLGVPGVAKADKYIVRFSLWKRPDGGGVARS